MVGNKQDSKSSYLTQSVIKDVFLFKNDECLLSKF